jgi:hypothetical protein
MRALIIAVMLSGWFVSGVQAQTACNPSTLFNGITPSNFITTFVARIKACAGPDIDAAIADANMVPVDYATLACLVPLQSLAGSAADPGILTVLQKYRRVKASGVIANCINWVKATAAP